MTGPITAAMTVAGSVPALVMVSSPSSVAAASSTSAVGVVVADARADRAGDHEHERGDVAVGDDQRLVGVQHVAKEVDVSPAGVECEAPTRRPLAAGLGDVGDRQRPVRGSSAVRGQRRSRERRQHRRLPGGQTI